MQHVFAYTLAGSGTRWLGNLCKEGLGAKWWSEACLRQRGFDIAQHNPLEMSCSQLDSHLGSCLLSEERQSKIVVIHTHIDSLDNAFFQSLLARQPSIPVLATVRDPLATINTWRWEKYIRRQVPPSQESTQDRLKRAKHISFLLEGLLSLPRSYVRFCSVDAFSSAEKRLEHTRGQFDQAGIFFTDKAAQLVNRHDPVGSLRANRKLKTLALREECLAHKSALVNGDVAAIRGAMSTEFEYLRRQTRLKQQLFDFGYRNLSWW